MSCMISGSECTSSQKCSVGWQLHQLLLGGHHGDTNVSASRGPRAKAGGRGGRSVPLPWEGSLLSLLGSTGACSQWGARGGNSCNSKQTGAVEVSDGLRSLCVVCVRQATVRCCWAMALCVTALCCQRWSAPRA
jgi:hypothetical protein